MQTRNFVQQFSKIFSHGFYFGTWLVKKSRIFADTKAKSPLYDKEINVFALFFFWYTRFDQNSDEMLYLVFIATNVHMFILWGSRSQWLAIQICNWWIAWLSVGSLSNSVNEFTQGAMVYFHTETTRMRISVPTRMVCTSCKTYHKRNYKFRMR